MARKVAKTNGQFEYGEKQEELGNVICDIVMDMMNETAAASLNITISTLRKKIKSFFPKGFVFDRNEIINAIFSHDKLGRNVYVSPSGKDRYITFFSQKMRLAFLLEINAPTKKRVLRRNVIHEQRRRPPKKAAARR